MGMVGTTPIIDGLQEFKVQSHNDSSVYGGVLGGIVNVASKVGTNQYHGDAWEFIRNNELDARNYFFADTIPYKQNQFGGELVGRSSPVNSAAAHPRVGSLRLTRASEAPRPTPHCSMSPLRRS